MIETVEHSTGWPTIFEVCHLFLGTGTISGFVWTSETISPNPFSGSQLSSSGALVALLSCRWDGAPCRSPEPVLGSSLLSRTLSWVLWAPDAHLHLLSREIPLDWPGVPCSTLQPGHSPQEEKWGSGKAQLVTSLPGITVVCCLGI